VWLLVATALLLSYTVFRASRRALWHDELCTLYLATLPTLGDVWRVVRSGMDQLPPYPYVLVRALLGLTGRPEIDLRLPPTLAFAVSAWAVFAFLRRIAPPLYAVAGAALLLVTPAYAMYATDGRPYGLMCACSALALLAWQRTDAPRRSLALGTLALSLSLALASHTYAVFLLLPLLAGEVVRARERGRADVPVAVALSVPLVVLVPTLQILMEGARAKYLEHFWAKAHLMQAPGTYAAFFAWLPAALAPLVVVTLVRAAKGSPSSWRPSALPAGERTMLLAGAALPVVVVVAARFTTGIFTPRYVSPAILPVVLLVAWGACRVSQGSRRGALLVLAGTGAVFLHQEREFLRSNHGPAPVPTPALASGARAGLPILLLEPNRFLDTLHYAEPDLRSRLVFAADPAGALRETGTDTADLVFLDMRRFFPLRVVEHERFVENKSSFLIWGLSPTHTVERLRREGWRLELLGVETGRPLLLASRP